MPAKKTTAPAPAPVVAAPEPVKSVTDFDWDLPEPEVAEYTRVAPSKDWEAETPAAIKHAVKVCFDKKTYAKDGTVIPAWMRQECGSIERAEAFVKAARGYAKFLGHTFRGAVNGTSVRYSVRPFEARARKA